MGRIFLLFTFAVSFAYLDDTSQLKSIHHLEWEKHQGEQPAIKGDGSRPLFVPLNPSPEILIEKTVYGYSPYWTNDQYLHFNKITHYACFSVGVNGDGSLNNSHNFPLTWAWGIAHAHRAGVKVILCAACFNGSTIHSAITTGATNLINNLLTVVRNANIEGVNIDFEGVLSSDRMNITNFIRRLSAAFRPYGLEVTMATPPVDWSNAFDYRALADTTDGLFIMGYNYHYSGSSEAGPVAPLTGWGTYNIRWTINDYLIKTNYNRDKIILGLPYYGYEWPTQSGNVHSRTTGPGTAIFYSSAIVNGLNRGERWDSESQTPWYSWLSGSQWYQGWFDNETSLLLKYNDVNNNRLVGSGIWALAYDGARQELWRAILNGYNRPGSNFVNGDCETWIIDTVGVPSNPNPVPPGWCLNEYADWERADDYVRSGRYAIRHYPDSLGRSWPVNSAIYQDVLVAAGARYEFSGWARKNDGCGNRMKLNLQWFDSDRNVISEENSPELVSDSNQYRFLTTGPVIAPTGVRFARLRLFITGRGYWDRWDDLAFVQVSEVKEAEVRSQKLDVGLEISPNPFGEKTVIKFEIRNPKSEISLRIYDASGRLIKHYNHLTIQPFNRIVWFGCDESGCPVAAGAYFVVLETSAGRLVKKLLHLK